MLAAHVGGGELVEQRRAGRSRERTPERRPPVTGPGPPGQGQPATTWPRRVVADLAGENSARAPARFEGGHVEALGGIERLSRRLARVLAERAPEQPAANEPAGGRPPVSRCPARREVELESELLDQRRVGRPPGCCSRRYARNEPRTRTSRTPARNVADERRGRGATGTEDARQPSGARKRAHDRRGDDGDPLNRVGHPSASSSVAMSRFPWAAEVTRSGAQGPVDHLVEETPTASSKPRSRSGSGSGTQVARLASRAQVGSALRLPTRFRAFRAESGEAR